MSSEQNDSTITLYASALSASVSDSDAFVIDSCATQHMVNNVKHLSSLASSNSALSVEVGNGNSLAAKGLGTVTLKLKLPDNEEKCCVLENVLFVTGLSYNLISVSQAAKNGNTTTFFENSVTIVDKNQKLVAIGNKEFKLYFLDYVRNVQPSDNISSTASLFETWHRRFCHLGADNLKLLINNNLVRGIDCKISNHKLFCENCCYGKMEKASFPILSEKIIRKPLELVHSDVCGIISPSFLSSGSYFVTFIDDCSRY